MKLKELEKRLKQEPDNLGLRVTVAGLMREAGRNADAVELYRSVALAYRDRGRTQQAIAVCRSILELAPDDRACNRLLAELLAPPGLQAQRATPEQTPLPRPLAHHVADPTSGSVPRISYPGAPGESSPLHSGPEVTDVDDLPASEGATTRPGDEDRPSTAGLAQAARTISGLFANVDLSEEVETRQRPRIESEQIRKISQPPPTVPVAKVDLDDMVTPVPSGEPRDSETELTRPRERVDPDDD